MKHILRRDCGKPGEARNWFECSPLIATSNNVRKVALLWFGKG